MRAGARVMSAPDDDVLDEANDLDELYDYVAERLDRLLDDGHDAALVATASLDAAAAFTASALSRGGTCQVASADAQAAVALFAARLASFLAAEERGRVVVS
jgi:hypothetical protein